MKKTLISMFAVVMLCGCASNYQQFERGFFTTEKGGYNDYQLDDDQFCVSYTGSRFDSAPIMNIFSETGSKKIHAYALQRAASVTRENGFRYFVVTSEKKGSVPGGGTANNLDTVTLQIKCYRENPPPDALDCQDITLYQN